MTTVLKVEQLHKVYKGESAAAQNIGVAGINFAMMSGEFVGIMGPSGSGKTTLLNLISGIDQPTSGQVEISGSDIKTISADELAQFRRQKMGFIFQDFNLLDSLTLAENVMLPMILDNKDEETIQIRTAATMKTLGIHQFRNKYPYEVSGGQQQRAAIGRAIINTPDIVFADEPTGNLDSKSSKSVMLCLEKLNAEEKTSVLLVTHDPYAASYCNRVVFIKDGLISQEIERTSSRQEFMEIILRCLTDRGGDCDDI